MDFTRNEYPFRAGRWSGSNHKKAQSLKKFGVNFDLKNILTGLDGFALYLHNTSKREALLLDEQVAIIFAMSESKILKMATYLSDVKGINGFLSPGSLIKKRISSQTRRFARPNPNEAIALKNCNGFLLSCFYKSWVWATVYLRFK